MLKFFRRLRRRLLDEGRLKRYLVYAVGEILLIMIGILLALQLNNWNEARKLTNEQFQLLVDLKQDLLRSKQRLQGSISRHDWLLSQYDTLLVYIENDRPYNPVLDSTFISLHRFATPNLSYAAYETLKSRGLSIIQNEQLREAIRSLYEVSFQYLSNDVDKAQFVVADLLEPFSVKHWRNYGGAVARPLNFESLKQNDEFINLVYKVRGVRSYASNRFERVNLEIEELILEIDKELETIN